MVKMTSFLERVHLQRRRVGGVTDCCDNVSQVPQWRYNREGKGEWEKCNASGENSGQGFRSKRKRGEKGQCPGRSQSNKACSAIPPLTLSLPLCHETVSRQQASAFTLRDKPGWFALTASRSSPTLLSFSPSTNFWVPARYQALHPELRTVRHTRDTTCPWGHSLIREDPCKQVKPALRKEKWWRPTQVTRSITQALLCTSAMTLSNSLTLCASPGPRDSSSPSPAGSLRGLDESVNAEVLGQSLVLVRKGCVSTAENILLIKWTALLIDLERMCFANMEEGALCLGTREASQRRWHLDSLTKKSLHPYFVSTYPGASQMSLLWYRERAST